MCIYSCVVSVLFIATACCGADPYPSKPVRWIVPLTPGGSTDLISRVIAQRLTEAWGVKVVAENRPGSDGTIGLAAAAKSPPDGYTMVLAQLGLPLLCLGLWRQHTMLAAVGGLMLWLSFVLHATRIWPVLWPKGDVQHGKTISDRFGRTA